MPYTEHTLLNQKQSYNNKCHDRAGEETAAEWAQLFKEITVFLNQIKESRLPRLNNNDNAINNKSNNNLHIHDDVFASASRLPWKKS